MRPTVLIYWCLLVGDFKDFLFHRETIEFDVHFLYIWFWGPLRRTIPFRFQKDLAKRWCLGGSVIQGKHPSNAPSVQRNGPWVYFKVKIDGTDTKRLVSKGSL